MIETRIRGIQSSGGFSLVEVALAILVVGLGLLTVFTLFPAGLSMNQKSVDETRAALFAEEVLNGYRARIDMSTNEWLKMGQAFPPGLEAVASGMWLF